MNVFHINETPRKTYGDVYAMCGAFLPAKCGAPRYAPWCRDCLRITGWTPEQARENSRFYRI